MTRRTIALGILGLWVVGLAPLYRRSTFRSPEQSLAEAGMKVSPATYYYRLEQNNQQIGAASSALDTTTALLLATDYVRAVVAVASDTLQVQARSVARISRALSMKDFILKTEGDLSPFLLRGVMQGDGTALEARPVVTYLASRALGAPTDAVEMVIGFGAAGIVCVVAKLIPIRIALRRLDALEV